MPAAITPNTPKACLVIDAPIISAAGQRTESQLRRGALGALTDDLVPVQNEASFLLPKPHRAAAEPIGPYCPRRSAAPHKSSSRQKLRGDRVCFAQRRVPAWASPSAQVPRPEHLRRSTNDAAPSRRRRYAIRRILLTDSVAYASWGRIGRKLGCSGVISRGVRASSVPSTTHPPVVHRARMFSTAMALVGERDLPHFNPQPSP
jgi:hypothetical protein